MATPQELDELRQRFSSSAQIFFKDCKNATELYDIAYQVTALSSQISTLDPNFRAPTIPLPSKSATNTLDTTQEVANNSTMLPKTKLPKLPTSKTPAPQKLPTSKISTPQELLASKTPTPQKLPTSKLATPQKSFISPMKSEYISTTNQSLYKVLDIGRNRYK